MFSLSLLPPLSLRYISLFLPSHSPLFPVPSLSCPSTHSPQAQPTIPSSILGPPGPQSAHIFPSCPVFPVRLSVLSLLFSLG
jgi:hypothetical protein